MRLFQKLTYNAKQLLKSRFSGITNPPGPVIDIKLAVKDKNKVISDFISVKMIIDTGADRSCIPKDIINSLCKQIGETGLPFSITKVLHTNGIQKEEKKYQLITNSHDFNINCEYSFVALDMPLGCLGRDILNSYTFTYDGPSKEIVFNT